MQEFARAFLYTSRMVYQFFFNWKQKIIPLLSNWHYIFMIFCTGGFFFGTLFLSRYISSQNDILHSSTPVGDLFFEIIPKLDLSLVFVGVAVLLVTMGVFYAIFLEPEKIPLVFLAFSLFFLIRSFCISLTYIGVPADHTEPNIGTGDFFFHNDLFFSGHTGAPFLVALLLWEKKFWRYFLLGISIIMAFTVISMRLHYSIDVVGAYFITYGIFHIAEYLYNADRKYNKFLREWFLQT